MVQRYHFSIQLKDKATGKYIGTSGGVCYVAKNGLAGKQAITDEAGTAATNPSSLTNGNIDFWATSLTNDMVDLYIACPGGQFLVARNIAPSGPNELEVDTTRMDQVMVIPFEQDDFTANTETDTGFDEPVSGRAIFLPDAAGPSVFVVDTDSGETLDVGTGEVSPSESGDANGFMAAASIATGGLIQDQGALMTTLVGHLSGGKSITITTSAGSDTGSGYIYLPYRLFN